MFYYYLLTNVSCYTEDCVIYRGSLKGGSTVLIYITHNHPSKVKDLDPGVKYPLYKSLFVPQG